MNFEYQPLVSWPFFFGFLAVIILIGGLALFFQWKKKTAPKRLVIRLLLLLGFIFCLSMAVVRPQRTLESAAKQILVYQDGLQRSVIDFWKDSLDLSRAVALSKLQPRSERVFLLGDSLTSQQLYPLRTLDFDWILPENNGLIRNLNWKGFVRKGEVQRLGFELFSDSDSAKLEVAGSKLEAKALAKGWNAGLLEFYPSGLGKAEFPLLLEKDTLAMIRFYIGVASPKKYHFQLGFPGAESRTLGNWLREKGETVTEEILLSKETVLLSGAASDSLQILFIDPSQLDRKAIQDRVKKEKTALVLMNVSQPVETAQMLNRVFGTEFQVSRTTQDESRTLANGVEVLPFSFSEKAGQKLLHEGSLAIQYAGSLPIAMSLISASYPLSIQEENEAYEQLWGALLGLLEPNEESAWRMEAPLLSGISKEVGRFAMDSLAARLVWDRDTLNLQKSIVNPFLAEGSLQLSDSAWVDLDSGFSAYVYGDKELFALKTGALVRDIQDDLSRLSTKKEGLTIPVSPWIWMVGMLLSLGLLWLEPKLEF